MSTPTTHKLTHKDGQSYWVERRVGFSGIEWNYGAGWRASRVQAFRIAKISDALNIADSTPVAS